MSVEIVDDSAPAEAQKPSNPDVRKPHCLMMKHPWHGVKIGDEHPDVINAIIEIPSLSRAKTELDIPTGLLKVDKILHSSVIYPANYGFVPETCTDGGNPLDILVLCQLTIPSMCLMKVRPIGLMRMLENGESDDKIIAVAVHDPEYNIYYDISELPPFKLLMINQFFNDYKTLERKVVRTSKPIGNVQAKEVVENALKMYYDVYGDDDE